MTQRALLHGTAVAFTSADFGLSAVFLRGPSGRGKSDLAFRLIAMGWQLIGDDQVAFERRQVDVMALSVPSIEGLMELRGVGLVRFPPAPPAPLKLVIDLVPREDVPRLPEKETVDILGISVSCLKLHAFDASTPYKITKALELVNKPELLV